MAAVTPDKSAVPGSLDTAPDVFDVDTSSPQEEVRDHRKLSEEEEEFKTVSPELQEEMHQEFLARRRRDSAVRKGVPAVRYRS